MDLDKVFGDKIKNPRSPLGGLVGRSPTFDSEATKAADGSRVRVVLAKVDTDDGGRASGATATLFAGDGKTLLDSARVDQRGLVLLRFPRGTGSDLGRLKGKLKLGKASSLLDVDLPQGEQHVLMLTSIDPTDVVGPGGEPVGAAGDALGDIGEDIGDLGGTLEEAVTALTDAAEALTAAAESAAADLEAATAAVTSAAGQLEQAATALAEAANALTAAASGLADSVPTDSVVSRLPISFSPALGDAVTRLLEVAEGPIPGIDSSTAGISTSRVPLIKEITELRVVEEDGVARRFLVRIRQEWTFIGFTLGELVRVDSLDPASVTGTLNAALSAQVRAGITLDASTASRLQAALSGQLSAQAAIDSTLDIAVKARLDAKLKASIRAGVRDDPVDSFSSAGQFFSELGTSVLDFLLPDLGVDANADLNAALDVQSHADLSVRSSLLASARVNASASLVNQMRVQVSASLDASTQLDARLVAQINPSLARAVNLLRFVLYDVYAVTSRVEDVTEVVEQSVFAAPPPGQLLFPPADVLEYRPFFQRALLDRSLLPHFGLLRRALGALRSGGDPIRRVRFLIEYSATGAGGDLAVRIAGQRATVRLVPGQPATTVTVNLLPPIRPDDLNEARFTLTRRDGGGFFPLPGSAVVTRIEVRYDGGGDPEDLADLTTQLTVGFTDVTDQFTMPLNPAPLDFDPATDPLVLHVNRNQHYYLGVLAEAAIRVPSLRQDAPQLQSVGVDHPLWKLPLLGFEADRALILREVDAGDAVVKQLIDDEGTSTIVQLAAAGLYTEVAQGRNQISEVAGRIHPALSMAQPPLPDIQGLGVLSNAGGLGSPDLVAALAAANGLQQPSLPNLAALAQLVNAGRPPEGQAPNPGG
jgi:hypothetical protein